MARWHGYFGMENIGLNAAQRAALVAVLRALGPSSDPSPARLCHWATLPDGEIVVFEAAFAEDALTVDAFKQRLGSIFGVSPATIAADVSTVTLAERASVVAMFSRSGTDYLRVALFGGVDATWAESRIEALAYLASKRGSYP